MEMESKFLTVKKFSDEFSVTEPTVRLWIRKKKIKAAKLGRKWMIPIEQFEKCKRELFNAINNNT